MNQHNHQHSHENHSHSHTGQAGHASRRTLLPKNWVFVAGVVLMLAAMGIYVMSLDEGLQPDGQLQAPVPEAN